MSSSYKELDSLIFPGGVPSRVVREQRANPSTRTEVEDNGEPDWAVNPKIVVQNGVEREFYYVNALAKALNRSVKAIYKWEDNGWLPKARYRTSTRQSSLPGKAAAGRRLYTREQIEAVVAAAKAVGAYEVSRKAQPDWAKFRRLVVEAWSAR